ncbi:hypothetical protein ACQEVI_20775 [Promicromonospora sp. CA-289599]|uniref:hypothetical protein n=1 Tax=Promicromonospora sp. CA-289599 TaxID=3240014 RepID=UPI003D926D03
MLVLSSEEREALIAWAVERHEGADASEVGIQDVGDLDRNGKADFLASVSDPMWCGSGGCAQTVYLNDPYGDGKHEEILPLLGTVYVETRDEPGFGYLTLVFDDNVGAHSLYRWSSSAYQLGAYEIDCSVHEIECEGDSLLALAVDTATTSVPLAVGSTVHSAPSESAAVAPMAESGFDPLAMSPLGQIQDTDWYLVEVWKGNLGFVRAPSVG